MTTITTQYFVTRTYELPSEHNWEEMCQEEREWFLVHEETSEEIVLQGETN